MPFQYRDHRGGYAESMATVQTFNSYDELVAYLQADLAKMDVIVHHEKIDIQPYGGIDERNQWDTHIVTAKVNDESIVCGFTDKWVLPMLNMGSQSSAPRMAMMRHHFVTLQQIGATRKNDDIVTLRIRPRVPSKRAGRRGTRRDWKRQHSPLSVDIRLSVDEEKFMTRNLIAQRILSQKHL